MEKPTQTLEDVIREKLNTGYDPIKLSVKSKALNEENIVVAIEGIEYSIRDNTLSCIEKAEKAAETPLPPEDPAHPVNGGDSGNPEEPAPALDQAVTDETQTKIEVSGNIEERINRVLFVKNAVSATAVSQNDSGDWVFDVNDASGQVIATGTLEELEASIAA